MEDKDRPDVEGSSIDTEPPDCPICGYGYFFGFCSGCGYQDGGSMNTTKHGGCHECGKDKDDILQSRTTRYEVTKKNEEVVTEYGSIALCTDCAERVDRGK